MKLLLFFCLSDWGVAWTTGTRVALLLMDAALVGVGGGWDRDFWDVNVSPLHFKRPLRSVVRTSTDGEKQWSSWLEKILWETDHWWTFGAQLESQTARNSQGTLIKKVSAVWHFHKYMPCDHLIQRFIGTVTVDVGLAVCSPYQNQVVGGFFPQRALMPAFDLSKYPSVFFPSSNAGCQQGKY